MMSSLADEINAISARGCCGTGTWYVQQDPEGQAAFDRLVELVKAGERRSKDLYDVCVKHGLQISNKSFRDHLTNHMASNDAG